MMTVLILFPMPLSMSSLIIDIPTVLFFFKIGLCYGKLEAAVLAIIIPTCLLGHLVLLLQVNLAIYN